MVFLSVMEWANHLVKYVNKCEVRREKYTLPDLAKNARHPENDTDYAYPALRDPPFFTEPLNCTWALMSEVEVLSLLTQRNLDTIKTILDKKMSHYPKGIPRLIAVELLYGGYKFAKNSKYNATQSGALLSMLYMTHRFFNSSHRTTAEDVFWFFKELMCYHSLDFVPTHQLVYSPDQANLLLSYFCKTFLRHLPIIRLLGLPNFEMAVNTYIPPFPKFKKTKSVDGSKAGKKGKAKKEKAMKKKDKKKK